MTEDPKLTPDKLSRQELFVRFNFHAHRADQIRSMIFQMAALQQQDATRLSASFKFEVILPDGRQATGVSRDQAVVIMAAHEKAALEYLDKLYARQLRLIGEE